MSEEIACDQLRVVGKSETGELHDAAPTVPRPHLLIIVRSAERIGRSVEKSRPETGIVPVLQFAMHILERLGKYRRCLRSKLVSSETNTRYDHTPPRHRITLGERDRRKTDGEQHNPYHLFHRIPILRFHTLTYGSTLIACLPDFNPSLTAVTRISPGISVAWSTSKVLPINALLDVDLA